jgi:hypothetical protein
MSNQKDTKKTYLNTYRQSDVSDIKSLSDKHSRVDESIYEFANKKTEKLVTALYMVSDCMDTDDALKGKIRLLGVELLSDIYKLSTLPPVDKNNYISIYLTHINELLSFIEIAYTIGFISEMNTSILKKEFFTLTDELRSNQSKDKHFTFTLDNKMFELPELKNVSEGDNYTNQNNSLKDMSLYTNKKTSFNTMSFTNNKSPLQNSQNKKTKNINLADKQNRINKIISVIKDKKDIEGNQTGVSIKDISLLFTDCSEKTIQRELNSLVSKGQLKKTGEKRWSRYGIVSSHLNS